MFAESSAICRQKTGIEPTSRRHSAVQPEQPISADNAGSAGTATETAPADYRMPISCSGSSPANFTQNEAEGLNRQLCVLLDSKPQALRLLLVGLTSRVTQPHDVCSVPRSQLPELGLHSLADDVEVVEAQHLFVLAGLNHPARQDHLRSIAAMIDDGNRGFSKRSIQDSIDSGLNTLAMAIQYSQCLASRARRRMPVTCSNSEFEIKPYFLPWWPMK